MALYGSETGRRRESAESIGLRTALTIPEIIRHSIIKNRLGRNSQHRLASMRQSADRAILFASLLYGMYSACAHFVFAGADLCAE